MIRAVVACLVVLAGCQPLEALELDQCGNAVLEPERGEDCDSYATEPGTTCAAAGEAHECRYLCSEPGTSNGCPAAWRCGADGVCRQPAGALGAAEAIAQPGGLGLALADLDGDVVSDLIVVDADRVNVAYLEGGELRQTFEMPLQAIGVPFIAEASGDGLTDLVVPTADGLATLRGAPSRELLPTSYASYPLPTVDDVTFVAIDLFPDLLLVSGILRSMAGKEYLALTTAGLFGLGEGWDATFVDTWDFDKIVRPAVGDFDESDTSQLLLPGSKTPEEIVVGFRGEDHVTVRRAQLVPGSQFDGSVRADFVQKPAIVVSVGSEKLGDSMIAVQLNPPINSNGDSAIECAAMTPAPGDEHLDLLIDVAGPGMEHRTVAAFGLGNGEFHSDPCTLGIAPPDNTAALQPWLGCVHQLLTAGQLDSDGFVDVVTAAGAWLTSLLPKPIQHACDPEDPGVTFVWSLGQFWSEAALGDFDGNGLTDVVAADRAGALDVLLGSADSPPTITTVPTFAPASQIAVADFDGDHADDVAFIERFGTESDDTLSIVFGEPFGAPLPARAITSAPDIMALVGFDQRRFSQAVADAASELLLATRRDGETSGALLWGRSDRQIYAPLLFFFPMGPPLVPLSVAVGNFELDDDPNTTERGIFALGIGLNNFVAVAAGVVVAENQIDVVPTNRPVTGADGGTGSVALAVSYIEAAKDAPVFLGWQQPSAEAPTAQRATRILAPSYANQAWDHHDALVLDGIVPFGAGTDLLFQPKDRIGDWSRQLAPIARRCALDASGLGSVGFVVIEPVDCPGGATGSKTALYFLAASTLASIAGGTPTTEGLTILPPPENETVLAFTCMQTDLDPDDELVMLTLAPSVPSCDAPADSASLRANLYLTELDAGGFLPLRLLATIDPKTAPELAGGLRLQPPFKGMAAGDADGDGVDDVAIATTSRVLLFRGQAVNP